MRKASVIKVVVTGASGHLGFHIAAECLARGYETRILVRALNSNVEELQFRGARVTICDLRSPPTFRAAMSDVDCLFHAAAENTTNLRSRDRTLQNTLNIAETVLASALDAGIPVLVNTSSVVALGRSDRPEQIIDEDTGGASLSASRLESPYVEGKVLTEQLCERLIRERRADIRRMYPSWLVGPADLKGTPPHKVIADFLAKGQRFWFKGGISVASVVEAAKAHVNAYELGRAGGRYIVAGENVTFREFFTILAGVSGRKAPTIELHKPLVLAASHAATALFRLVGAEFPLPPAYAKSIIGRYSWYSSARAQRELGYRVRPVGELLAEAVLETRRRQAGVITLGRRRVADKSLPPQQVAPQTATASAAKLLITGVPGWLGNRMVDILINGDRFGRFASNRPVRLLVEPRFRGLLQLPRNFEIVYGDLCDSEAVRQAVQGASSVFHLAGAIYPPRTEILYRVNDQGTRTLVDACVAAGVRRMIYMGTDSICGRGTKDRRIFDEHTPASPYRHYGRSKYMGENYLLQRTHEGKMDGTSLRGFWFFGPFAPARQKNFVRMFRWPRQLVFGHGQNLRSISHVDDIIAAFFQSELRPATIGKWYWICESQPHSVDEIYAAIARAMAVPYRPFHLPVPVCGCFNLLDRLMGSVGRLHPTIHAAGKFYFDIAGDISAARRDFGFEPRWSLAEAAEELAGDLTGRSAIL